MSRQLIGRSHVLRRLEALAAASVEAGRLTVGLVEGPAGIGKTRLVSELAERMRAADAEVLVGHCVAQGGQTLPFAPLVDLLTDLVRREGVDAVRRWAGPAGAELGRLVPALGSENDAIASSSAGTGRLFQAFSSLLLHLSRRRPLLLVVEDVHWVDTSTRELLALLARQQAGPVLLLLTLRTDESPTPPGLARYLAELVRHGDQRVLLAPLTREEQARQIAEIRGLPPHRTLLDDVYARAEGNPFFAEELLTLGEEGRGLPATVRDLLLARLEALAPATRQVLRTASVTGREIPHRLLEAVVDLSGTRLEAALREAVDAHVLETRGDTLVFRHALLQEAIAASLLPGEAARTHRRLATTLTEQAPLAGSGHRLAGRIARHWDAAGEPERALVASVAAGRESSDALAFAESLSHYERALELVASVPDAEAVVEVPRARLLRWIAEVAHLAAHPDRATALIREAIDCADPEDAHLRGWLRERLGRYLWMAGDGQGALAAYQEAVALVPAEPPTRSRAAVLSGLSQILMLADRHAEAEAAARQAIDVAGRVPDGRSVEGHARCNLGVALGFTGRVEEGIAELRTALRIADDELDDPDENARALVNLSAVLVLAGRLEESARTALESVRVGDALGLRRRKGVWCRCDAAHVLTLLGDPDRAQVLLDEARELDPQGVDAFRTDLVEGQLRLRQGLLDEARTLLEHGRATSWRLLDPQLVSPLYATLVETATCQGDDDAAAQLTAEGLGRFDGQAHHPFFESALLGAAVRAAVAAGRPPEESEALLVRIRSGLARPGGDVPQAAADLAMAEAELAGTAEAWERAGAHWERLGDVYRCGYSRLRAAESLLAPGGDRGRAAEHLRAALDTARRIAAVHLVDRAEDLARRSRLAAATDAPPENPYRLTIREREVLARVAEGLTDRQIGSRLFISHRTVERHVSNLLAKLGAGRRSELVATALREGLVGEGPVGEA